METFRAKRTGTEELTFEGELLAKVNTPRRETVDGERGYELALYAKSGGGLVASFEYLTTATSESPAHLADVVDDPKDVENFFLVIEPCEYVDRETLASLPADQRKQFRKAMCAIYDGHVDIMLKALQDYVEQHHEELSSKAEEKSAPKKGMLSFLGLK